MSSGVTGSYNSTYPGGGNYYTGSQGYNLHTSQSFETNADLDLNLDVTNGTLLHYTGSLTNNGFIVKFDDELEFSLTSSIRHKYYSGDTNTIYAPTLDIKWDDSSYQTGSLDVLNTQQAVINLSNNKGIYPDIEKQRFRMLARPKYPTRTFTTSSIYLNEYKLSSGSYFGIKDESTGEMIVDFDTSFTKVSVDDTSNYFDFYMNSLEPERHYRLLVKTVVNDSTIVIDNKNIFKVTKHG